MFLSIVLPRVHTITKLRGKVAIQPEGFSCRLSENAPTGTLLEVWQGIKRNLMKRLGIQNTKKWKWNCWICISFDTLKDWGCNLQACWNIGLQNFAAFLLLVHAIIYLFSNPVRKLWNFPLRLRIQWTSFFWRDKPCAISTLALGFFFPQRFSAIIKIWHIIPQTVSPASYRI